MRTILMSIFFKNSVHINVHHQLTLWFYSCTTATKYFILNRTYLLGLCPKLADYKLLLKSKLDWLILPNTFL